MLKQIGFTNFKAWKKVDELKLGSITGFFGTNSSGKTSLLQPILLIKQTIEAADRALVLNFGDDRSPIDLGSFKDVVYKHSSESGMSFSFEWQLAKPLDVYGVDISQKTAPILSGDRIAFSVAIRESGARLMVSEMEYKYSGTTFRYSRKSEKGDYSLTADDNFQFIRNRGRVWELPAPVKCYGFPDQVKAYFQNAQFLADLELAFEQCFSRTFYLGPLRDFPRRRYSWAGTDPTDMGRKGEKVIDALLAARDRKQLIHAGKGKGKVLLEEYVADWLKRLGLIHSFSVESVSKDSEIYRVWVQRSPGSSKVLITDVGFGVSQVLPVLVLCFYVPVGSTIILEQPEIHLHPLVQSGLADLFIDAVKKRKIQIIFESHSEHLLRRLQRRIAEEKISQEDVSLYFADSSEGESSLEQLQVDMFGNIQNWPKDFFGNDFEEMALMTKAVLKRKSGQLKTK